MSATATMTAAEVAEWERRARTGELRSELGAPPPPSRKDAIRQALLDRYPDGVVPLGTGKVLAEEFGVTPQLVSLTIIELGIRTQRPPRKGLFCACGRRVTRPSPCRSCRWLTLPCAQCGRPKRVLQSVILNRFTHPERGYKTAHVFCNYRCFGAWKRGRPRDSWSRE